MSFYAVGIGRVPGVYSSWALCEAQVKGFSRAAFKKFKTQSEADAYVARFASGDAHVTVREKRKAEDEHADADKRLRTAELEVYTDGNCFNNGKPGALAGSGVYLVRNGGATESYSSAVPGPQTNNRAEIYALLMALDVTMDVDALCVRPDSEYVAKALTDPTWLDHWHRNGWRKHGSKAPVANVDLWTLVVRLLERRRQAGRADPQVKWVKAHADIAGNEAADKLADVGMSKRVLELRNLAA